MREYSICNGFCELVCVGVCVCACVLEMLLCGTMNSNVDSMHQCSPPTLALTLVLIPQTLLLLLLQRSSPFTAQHS